MQSVICFDDFARRVATNKESLTQLHHFDPTLVSLTNACNMKYFLQDIRVEYQQKKNRLTKIITKFCSCDMNEIESNTFCTM